MIARKIPTTILLVGIAACGQEALRSPDGGVREVDSSPDREIVDLRTDQEGADGREPDGGSFELIPFGARWKYLDDGIDPGQVWRTKDFDDSSWKEGPARLGFDTTVSVATVIDDHGGPPPSLLAFYVRHAFQVDDPSQFRTLDMGLIVDTVPSCT